MDAKRAQISIYQKTIADTLNSKSRGIGFTGDGEGRLSLLTSGARKQTTDADLHNAEAMLQTYDKTLGGQSGSGGNANEDHHRLQADDFKKLSSERLEIQANLAGLYAKRASLEASLRELSATTQRLASLQVTYDNLTNRVDQSQRITPYSTTHTRKHCCRSRKIPQILPFNAARPNQRFLPRQSSSTMLPLATSLAVLLSLGLSFVFGFFNIRVFIPSKGPKGRRLTTNDSHQQGEPLAVAGE